MEIKHIHTETPRQVTHWFSGLFCECGEELITDGTDMWCPVHDKDEPRGQFHQPRPKDGERASAELAKG